MKDQILSEIKSTSEGIYTIEGMPAKVTSTPGKLMSGTPEFSPPKRSHMILEDDSTNSPNKLPRRPLCSRSLKFDAPDKSAKVEDEVKSSTGTCHMMMIDMKYSQKVLSNLLGKMSCKIIRTMIHPHLGQRGVSR